MSIPPLFIPPMSPPPGRTAGREVGVLEPPAAWSSVVPPAPAHAAATSSTAKRAATPWIRARIGMSPRIAAECQRSVTPVFGADPGVIPTDRRREVEASTQAGSRVADATTMATRLGHEYRQSALLVASLVAPVALLLLLRRIPGIDPELHWESFPLFVVPGIAACALGVAVMAAVAAVRLRRTGVVL